MDFDDPRWANMLGGYRVPYDPRRALLALEQSRNVASAWAELWNELHHQGDIGEASYATVPHLVRIYAARGVPDYNTYALVYLIEECRKSGLNPEMPETLRQAYEAAWQQLFELGLREIVAAEDPLLISSIIAVIALRKGQCAVAQFAMSAEDEQKEMLSALGIIPHPSD